MLDQSTIDLLERAVLTIPTIQKVAGSGFVKYDLYSFGLMLLELAY
jgi:hypothetical protein